MTNWTTPSDLRAALQPLWDQGALLRAELTGQALLPLQLRLKKPGSTALTAHFEQVRGWIRQLQDAEGPYRLEWREINHRQLGRNRVPDAVWVDSLDAALGWLGKRREAARFAELCEATLARFADLRPWLERYPLRALEQADHWPRVLVVLDWFCSHPQCGLYLRQLDIPGVDTKFIEQRRGLLAELLDLILPAAAIEPTATGVRGFSRRYGLREKPTRVRLRILDPALAIAGLTDLELPVEQLATFTLAYQRAFVTENETNALAFPAYPGAILLFGQGYALDRLADLRWLHHRPLHYWGDIDTHGFAILDRLRAYFPHAQSLLMDRDTLLEHQRLWGQEPDDKRCVSTLTRLTAAERRLYDDLRHDRLQHGDGAPALRVRLEQEHIRFGWLQSALANIDTSPSSPPATLG